MPAPSAHSLCVGCGKVTSTIDDFCSDCHMKMFWASLTPIAPKNTISSSYPGFRPFCMDCQQDMQESDSGEPNHALGWRCPECNQFIPSEGEFR